MPATAATKLKRARVGLGIMAGQSQMKAGVNAGLAPATMKNASANGYGAEQCIRAAAELYPEIGDGQLVRQARHAMSKRLTLALQSDENLAATRLGEMARVFQVVEQYCGSGDADPTADVRKFADRLEWLAKLGAELDRRRTANARTVEAVAVPPEGTK
jgi:hypothetical protein